MIRKLLLYEEVAELFTVLLRREIFRLTQGRMDLLSELPGEQITDSGGTRAKCFAASKHFEIGESYVPNLQPQHASQGTQTGHSTQPAGLGRRKENQDENCEL